MKINKIFVLVLTIMLAVVPMSTQAAREDSNEQSIYVIPGGEPFGVKMFSEGLIVTKLESFAAGGKKLCPGKEAGLKANDIIYSADGILLHNNEQLKNIIEECQGRTIKLKIKRSDKYHDINLTPVMNADKVYKAGIWVKDSAAGLGTVTFYEDESGAFCGLGHGICDKQTNQLIPLSYGELDKANVTSITKSSTGNVGTLNGYFTDKIIGNAICNDETGVYGYETTNTIYKEKIEIADKNEVTKGPAYILTTIDGDAPQKFEIQIIRINMSGKNTNIMLKITDDKLLSETGGIVQGMSGSPIIQNGKLVGALSHVLVDNVDCGYGIFAKTMYDVMCEKC